MITSRRSFFGIVAGAVAAWRGVVTVDPPPIVLAQLPPPLMGVSALETRRIAHLEREMIEVTCFGDSTKRYVQGLPR